ncbi:YigZ family protein [Clostridium sp. AF15-17LB]|nr:YigZ family protein [Clostridium sp. AF15-17LB]
MTTEYRTVYEGGEEEIVEKKSRFIAAVKPVSAEDEALAFIESVRKRHWNATHNCYAYVIGERSELARCSDDGEPNGTAGKPMLDVLQGEELRNTAVVVTRYFGGTLLGTGGLVRAYAQAVKAGLASSVIITKIRGVKLRIGTDYTGLGKIQYILGQKGLKILDSEYADNVKLEVLVPEDAVEAVRSDITEGSSGQASMEEGEKCWFAQIDGQPVVLEEYTG